MKNNTIETLRKIDKEALQSLFDNSTSVSMVLGSFGFIPQRKDSRKLINQLIVSMNIDLTKMHQNLQDKVKAANSNTHQIRTFAFNRGHFIQGHRLIQNLKKSGHYMKCSECPITDTYNGKPISLQVHHIDGDNTNNTLENLALLCPNCHSQTDSYCGKKNKKPDNVCKCGTMINRGSKACRKCSHEHQLLNGRSRVKFEVSKEELELLIKNTPMTTIGKMFGVSDNAIRKRAVKMGIQLN